MINHKFISCSAVQIYDLSFIYSFAKIIVVVVSFSYKEAELKSFGHLRKTVVMIKTLMKPLFQEVPHLDLTSLSEFIIIFTWAGKIYQHSTNYDNLHTMEIKTDFKRSRES